MDRADSTKWFLGWKEYRTLVPNFNMFSYPTWGHHAWNGKCQHLRFGILSIYFHHTKSITRNLHQQKVQETFGLDPSMTKGNRTLNFGWFGAPFLETMALSGTPGPPALAQMILWAVTRTTTAAQPTQLASSVLCVAFTRWSLVVVNQWMEFKGKCTGKKAIILGKSMVSCRENPLKNLLMVVGVRNSMATRVIVSD